MCRISKYFSIAYQQAHMSEMNSKHGCVVVNAGRVIASGYNHHRTRLNQACCSSTHAEVAALYRAQGGHRVQQRKKQGFGREE